VVNQAMSKVPITYTFRPDARPEAESNVLAAVYKFVLFDSQTRRGDTYDLTDDSTPKTTTNGPRTTEQENT
jgi:hypothetical protein